MVFEGFERGLLPKPLEPMDMIVSDRSIFPVLHGEPREEDTQSAALPYGNWLSGLYGITSVEALSLDFPLQLLFIYEKHILGPDNAQKGRVRALKYAASTSLTHGLFRQPYLTNSK